MIPVEWQILSKLTLSLKKHYYSYLMNSSTSINEAFISIYLYLYSLWILAMTLSLYLGSPVQFY